jgi:heme/copper-type cytochrome/quinol oxidase subunit 3
LPASGVIQAPLQSNLFQVAAMFTRRHIESAGFMPPAERVLGRERRNAAIAELVTTIALALCTLLAVTAVTVGIAHADVAGDVIDNESSLFAIALLLGLLFIGMGGMTILSLPQPHRHKKTHG